MNDETKILAITIYDITKDRLDHFAGQMTLSEKWDRAVWLAIQMAAKKKRQQA